MASRISLIGVAIYSPDFLRAAVSSRCPAEFSRQIALGLPASFAECTAEKFRQRGNVWADVLRAAIVPRCSMHLLVSKFHMRYVP